VPGGGKSFALWSLMILKCIEFPLIRVGLARQTLSQIKRNTISTFYEVSRFLGLDESHYTYNEIRGEIKFFNGSVIQFFELRYLPSDPEYDRFGGALLTFGCIEEAAGCDNKGKQIFSSRLGRWMNDEYNIPPQLYMTCNPGTNFVYSDFYIPWTKNELEPHRKYIPALLSDNSYQSKFYANSLYTRLDKASADRLLKGLWNFDHDKARLITYDKVNALYDNYKQINNDYYITADIAFTGDKCIIILWQGLNVEKIIEYKGDEPELEIINLQNEYSVQTKNIVYDSDGVGKYLKGKLKGAYDFINNSKPIYNENYDHLKSQCYFKLAELINEEKIKIKDNYLKDQLIQEVYEIRSKPLETVEGKLAVIQKKEVKKLIGRSPDISDALAMRMVFEIKKPIVKPFTIRKR